MRISRFWGALTTAHGGWAHKTFWQGNCVRIREHMELNSGPVMSSKQVRCCDSFAHVSWVTHFFELVPPICFPSEVAFWFARRSLGSSENIKPLTCAFAGSWGWNILQCTNTVGVKCSPLLPILTGQEASAQTRLLLHSVTVTLQVNKTDGSAQVFLEGTNASVKNGLLGMGETKLSKHKWISIDAQPE